MATTDQRSHHLSMLVMRPVPQPDRAEGVWWPQSRSLCDELPKLIAMWSHDGGRIERILFSPPCWDDCPPMVEASGRWVRCGPLAQDDGRLITLVLSDQSRWDIDVIPPDASREAARHTFSEMSRINDELRA